jgi:hypothetical protein
MTAKQLINKENSISYGFNYEKLKAIDSKIVKTLMIEFTKHHVNKIQKLQESKYYAGETGYIKKEEWEEIINNIK